MGSNFDGSVANLAATIQRSLKASPQYSKRRCIYRIPNRLRQINEQAYTPTQVSIGPLHHNDKRLVPMEAHKLKYLEYFLGNPHANADLLNSCLKIVKKCESEIRKCYADPIDLSSDDFSKMILIDSVFIIEFLRRIRISSREDDYIFDTPFLWGVVLRDIRLEENQLPFFILDLLYRAAFMTNNSITSKSVPSFTEIVCKGFNVNCDSNANVDKTDYYHLLHLFALHKYRPIRTNTNTVKGNHKTISDLVFPPAVELHDAGVKFQVVNSSSSLMDIEFDKEKGILKMPKIVVDDYTKDMWRNLAAFEQCNCRWNDRRYSIDYHFFLDCLINTPEDVKLLIEADIIQTLTGSPEQVSDLINSLGTCTSTSFNGYYYEQISLQLQLHCKRRWNRYRATLMHSYFNHPWAVISVAYATVLFVLTVIQVVTDIMAIP